MQKNICLFCATEDKHVNHKEKIIKFSDIIPSNKDCEKIIKELINREKFIKSFILKVEKWKSIVMRKIEIFKQNLNKEVILFRKIISNFNKKYLNANYINNFKNIYQFLSQNNEAINNPKSRFLFGNNESNNKNDNIYLFYNENDINKMTKYLINLLDLNDDNKNENIIFNNEGEKLKFTDDNLKSIEFVNDDYIMNSDQDKVNIYYYYKNSLKNATSIQLNETVNNLSSSIFDNKIICTTSKSIFLLGYDLEKNNIYIIEKIQMSNINYCVEIKRNNLLAINNDKIILLENTKPKIEKNLKKQLFETEFILPVNEDYFISTFNSSIYFHDVNTLQEIKMLNVGYFHKIALFRNEYIISFDREIISLIYIKTKELVQIIEFDNKEFNNIHIINRNNICIGSGYFIYKMKYNSQDKYFDIEKIKVKEYNAVTLDDIFKYVSLSNF